MQKFTLSEMLEITEQENHLKHFFNKKNKKRMCSPKQETINNILNYSKALSIRKSEYLNFIEIILN
jgi:hypothetical protein